MHKSLGPRVFNMLVTSGALLAYVLLVFCILDRELLDSPAQSGTCSAALSVVRLGSAVATRPGSRWRLY